MSQGGTFSTGGSGGAGIVEFLSGNTGGMVGPDAMSNINIVGSGLVAISGNAGTNTLTVSFTGAGQAWAVITGSGTLVVDTGYVCVSPGGALVLTLPVTSSVGNVIEITLDGATSFQIAQNAGQSIRVGNQVTTVGVGGSLTTLKQGDSIRLVCSVANNRWNAMPGTMGSFTII